MKNGIQLFRILISERGFSAACRIPEEPLKPDACETASLSRCCFEYSTYQHLLRFTSFRARRSLISCATLINGKSTQSGLREAELELVRTLPNAATLKKKSKETREELTRLDLLISAD